jgi:hypothetical protein
MWFRYLILILIVSASSGLPLMAQLEQSFPSEALNYKVLQDDPKDMNHLWIAVQPITLDVLQMNAVVGSGIEVTYLPMPKLELKGSFRGNFVNAFDLQRTAALEGSGITTQESKREQGQMVLTNGFSRFFSFELGGFYALKDIIRDGASHIVVSDPAQPGSTQFASSIEVNAKVRQILGVRAGLNSLQTTVSLARSIKDNSLELKGNQGTVLDKNGTSNTNGFVTDFNGNDLFTRFQSTGFYVGGAIQRIKNISIKTDRQGILSNNALLTLYADILLNPWTQLDNIGARKVGGGTEETFDVEPVKTNPFGGRLGFELRYNQNSFLSLGGELGYRPSISGQGFYGLVKLSIPTFSFGSKAARASNNVGKNQSLTK